MPAMPQITFSPDKVIARADIDMEDIDDRLLHNIQVELSKAVQEEIDNLIINGSSTVEETPVGISWDGANTPWVGAQARKLYLTSGQFTSTLKDSKDVKSVNRIKIKVRTIRCL